MKKNWIKSTCLLCTLGFCFLSLSTAESIVLAPTDQEEIYMIKGDLENLGVYDLTRISITKPEVADIVELKADHVLILARSAGETTFFIWDRYGKRSVIVRVANDDLSIVKSRIQDLLAKTNIKNIYLEINNQEGRVVILGEVTEEEKGALEKILAPFGNNILDLVREKEENDLIQIDTQILELSTSYTKNLGIDWTSALTYTETLPTGTIHNTTDIFKLGKFSRTTQILSTINMLISEGKGRVLSKPKLTVLSGEEATFLVGGEIPVTETTTSSGGNVQENVSFRDYGISLHVKPTIRNDNMINIQLMIEVSDIDAANSAAGKPAFTTRNADTRLFLEDGQTVVIAGLIKSNEGETITRIPFLSDIPLVGRLFRHKRNPAAETETELVITLTPTIIYQKGQFVQRQEREQLIAKTQTTAERQPPAIRFSSTAFEKPASPSQRIPFNILPYAQSIQERIAQRVVYPEKARRYGWEGTVKLVLYLYSDGSLLSATIRESSGHDLFDEYALSLAKDLAPYSGFPTETNLQDLIVTIPIVYSLDTGY